MNDSAEPDAAKSDEEARLRFEEAAHMQAVEGNPLTDEDLALFAMFEREGWSAERQRAYIVAEAQRASRPLAAE